MRAIAPVAAEIIPRRPPKKAIRAAMENEAYRPTFGSTPAIMEKAIASGISASATTGPATRKHPPRPPGNALSGECTCCHLVRFAQGARTADQSLVCRSRGCVIDKVVCGRRHGRRGREAPHRGSARMSKMSRLFRGSNGLIECTCALTSTAKCSDVIPQLCKRVMTRN